MADRLDSTQQAQVDLDTNTIEYLLEIDYLNQSLVGQTVYYTTASQDLLTSSTHGVATDATWTALGLPGGGSTLALSEVRESFDSLATGLDLQLDGVDQTIIAIILQNHFRGQEIKIWRIWLDDVNGDIEAGVLLFQGFQNDEYTVEEQRPEEVGVLGSCTVKTRVTSFVARMDKAFPLMTNEISHNAMLGRAGLTTGDTGFMNTPELTNKTIHWGDYEWKPPTRPPAPRDEESRHGGRGRYPGGR